MVLDNSFVSSGLYPDSNSLSDIELRAPYQECDTAPGADSMKLRSGSIKSKSPTATSVLRKRKSVSDLSDDNLTADTRDTTQSVEKLSHHPSDAEAAASSSASCGDRSPGHGAHTMSYTHLRKLLHSDGDVGDTVVRPQLPASVFTAKHIRYLFYALVLIVCVYYWWPWKFSAVPSAAVSVTSSSSGELTARQQWGREVQRLVTEFDGVLTPGAWSVARAALGWVLSDDRQPATLALLAANSRQQQARRLALALAERLWWVQSNATGERVSAEYLPLLVLDAAHFSGLEDSEAKLQLEGVIMERLRQLPSTSLVTVVVFNVHRLKPLTAMLFHAFCDNNTAPRKRALFVFQVSDDAAPLKEPTNLAARRRLEQALWKSWGERLGADIFQALFARVGGNVALVNGPSSS